MIGNDRLYIATRSLVEGHGDAKARVVVAMRIIENLRSFEFNKNPEIWARICTLKRKRC